MPDFEVHRVEHRHEAFDDELYTPENVDEPIIHLFGYDDDETYHHVKVRGFEPYCYARYEHRDWIKRQSYVKRIETRTDDGENFESVRGERMVKVVTYGTDGVKDLSDAVGEADTPLDQTWESDVLFPNRFMADMDLESGISYEEPTESDYVHIDSLSTCTFHTDCRIHYVDIEVDDRNGFPMDGREPILCITAYDSFDDTYIVWVWDADGADADYSSESTLQSAPIEHRTFESESAMLLNYLAYVAGTRPSVYTAWNVEFDLTYLWDRCEWLNENEETDIPYQMMSPMHSVSSHDYFGESIRGCNVFDLLDALKSTQYTDMDSYRLEDVGQAFLGVGKEQYVGTVGQLWVDDIASLVDYNLRDVELMVMLDEQQDLVNFWREVGRIARCPLEDTTIESSVVDKYLLSDLHGEYVLPRQGSQPKVAGTYTGGAVFSAVNGLYKNVPMLDLASLYPMSMLTINISPETKVEDPESFDGETYISPNGIHFRKDKEGITKRVIEELLKERDAKKAERDEHDAESRRYKVLDLQQLAIKVIMNSLYGVLAWNRFRLYDPDGAKATTATGREVLQFTADVAEEMGHEVLYGDTDSVLLNLDDELDMEAVLDISHDVAATINDRYQEFAEDMLNADEHFFDIEFEKYYERFFQSGQKKRYAGRIRWKEGKVVDDIDITGYEYQRSDASELANEVQEHVLREICMDATPEEISEYVHEQIKRMERAEVTLEEIGIPEGIGKRLDNYSSPTHSVRAAKYGNLLLGTTFSSGAKPRRYYLDGMEESFYYNLEQEWADPTQHPFYAKAKRDNPPYLAVERPEQLPGQCSINWKTHEIKCLKQTLDTITSALGLEWDEMRKSSKQSDLTAFAD